MTHNHREGAGKSGSTPSATPAGSKPIRLRAVALPVEHGSWGLTLEPILLGLLAAPSWGGAALSVGAFSAFLLRWPLKLVRLGRHQRRPERSRAALRFCALYGLVTVLGFGAAVALVGWYPMLPLLFASPFGLIFFAFDATNQSRSWQAELAGPIAFSSVASSIALADGRAPVVALALWAALVARAVPSILYVRARIRLDKGRARHVALPVGAHVVALLAIGVFVYMGTLHVAVTGVFALLLVRAAWGLSPYRRKVPIKVIGFTELGWGLLMVLTVAVGARLAM